MDKFKIDIVNNNNNIKTFASATNKMKAASILRGLDALYYSNVV